MRNSTLCNGQAESRHATNTEVFPATTTTGTAERSPLRQCSGSPEVPDLRRRRPRGRVTLSREEQEAARISGLSLEEYACRKETIPETCARRRVSRRTGDAGGDGNSLPEIEDRIRAETAAARAAIKVALQHAVNVGRAYASVQELKTQSQVQAWLAGETCPVDRHTIMTCRRISMCDLNTNARTLADLMFDCAAEHIRQNTDVRSRSERIEINRASMNRR